MQLANNWSFLLIEIISGHLGNGRWRFRNINNVTVLALIQPFNRHGEHRIGPNQVLSYEVEQKLEKKCTVKIHLIDEQYCRAIIPISNLKDLDSMVNSTDLAPKFERPKEHWINAILLFFVVCILIKLFS